MTPITGPTYPIRRELKAMGGQWNANQQAWLVPNDRVNEARGLLGVGLARKNGSRVRRKSPVREVKEFIGHAVTPYHHETNRLKHEINRLRRLIDSLPRRPDVKRAQLVQTGVL